MPIEHHPLNLEFPQEKEKIHSLKIEDAHFRRLVNEYEGIDKSIYRAEKEIVIMNDEYLETVKKERLLLKDQIFSYLHTVTNTSQ